MQIQFLSYFFVFQSLFSCQMAEEKCFLPTSNLTCQSAESTEAGQPTATNIVFRSSDGGQTWEDVSDGLPADFQASMVFANDGEVLLHGEKGLYRSGTAAGSPKWAKDFMLGTSYGPILNGKDGPFLNSPNGFIQKVGGTAIWSPRYANLPNKEPRSILETTAGTIFIGSDGGIFKSTDSGKTWKNVFDECMVLDIVESGGAMIAGGQRGILRSTDGGEHWEWVISEGGVGVYVSLIEGGVGVISYNTTTKTRRMRLSDDGGKTWQDIDNGLPPSDMLADLKQVGEHLFCSNIAGVFRSADRGQTWQLVRPAVGKWRFQIAVSGKQIFAIPVTGGC